MSDEDRDEANCPRQDPRFAVFTVVDYDDAAVTPFGLPNPEAIFLGRSLGELEGEEFNDVVLDRENLLARLGEDSEDHVPLMDLEAVREELRFEIECLVANRDVARLRAVYRRRIAEAILLAFAAVSAFILGGCDLGRVGLLAWAMGGAFAAFAVAIVVDTLPYRKSDGWRWRKSEQPEQESGQE